jgi:hypothetical protein
MVQNYADLHQPHRAQAGPLPHGPSGRCRGSFRGRGLRAPRRQLQLGSIGTRSATSAGATPKAARREPGKAMNPPRERGARSTSQRSALPSACWSPTRLRLCGRRNPLAAAPARIPASTRSEQRNDVLGPGGDHASADTPTTRR